MPLVLPSTNSIMYGASLTKMAFAYMVLQLVDEGHRGSRPIDRSPRRAPLHQFSAYTSTNAMPVVLFTPLTIAV